MFGGRRSRRAGRRTRRGGMNRAIVPGTLLAGVLTLGNKKSHRGRRGDKSRRGGRKTRRH